MIFRSLPPLRHLLAVAALAILTGCAAKGPVVAADPLRMAPTASQSVIVVSVTSNTGQVSGFDEIILRKLPAGGQQTQPAADAKVEEERFSLLRVAAGISRDTMLFMGVLPVGQFEMVTLSDSRSRKFLNLHNSGRSTLGPFTVTAGRSVDLGRLILTPLNNSMLYGRSSRVTSNQDLLARFSPERMQWFKEAPSTGWNQAHQPGDRVEEYALSRPVGADSLTELDDGTVVAASRLGVVLMRSPEGAWRQLRGAGIESLMGVYPVQLEDADLLAVGEFGTLLRHPIGSDMLVPIDTGNLPPGSLLRIAGNPTVGWFIAHLHDNEVTLYRSATLEGGDWHPMGKEQIGFSFWTGANPYWVWYAQNGFGYTGSKGPLHFLDYATGQWQESPTPSERRILDIRYNPNGTLSILTSPGGGFGGITASVHMSKDMGQHWDSVEVPFTVKLAPVQQTRDGTMLMYGGLHGNQELQISKDQGQSWSHLGNYVPGRVLYPMKSGALLDIDLGQAGVFIIRSSPDGGKSWRTEYSNFNQAAADEDARFLRQLRDKQK